MPAFYAGEKGGLTKIVDSSNVASVSGGSFIVQGTCSYQATPTQSTKFSRTHGDTYLYSVTAEGTSSAYAIGPNEFASLSGNFKLGIQKTLTSYFVRQGSNAPTLSSTVPIPPYSFAFLLFATQGGLVLRYDGTNWFVEWISTTDNDSSIAGGLLQVTYTSNAQVYDKVIGKNLSTLGDAPLSVSSPVTTTEYTLPNSNFTANVTINGALPFNFRFGKQDANNYWDIDVSALGAGLLRQVTAGTPVTRATISGVGASDVVRISRTATNTIRFWATSNFYATAQYASASAFTGTTCEIASGTASSLVAYARIVTGTFASALEEMRTV
jgi:hypothetical protein